MVPAVAEADQIKGLGSHTFVIGVGDGVTDPLSQRRLVAMSGPNPFPTFPINTVDHTFITDFNQLEEALRQIASNLCDVTLTVTKETDEANPGTFVPDPAGRSAARSTSSSRPAIRSRTGGASRGGRPPAGHRDPVGHHRAAGSLRFVWRPVKSAATSSITVTGRLFSRGSSLCP